MEDKIFAGKMKIVLISPPFEQNFSIAKDKRRKAILEVVQPLGIAYVAAVLEKNNYRVKIFDFALGISQFDLMKPLKRENPDIIGITATSLSIASAQWVAMNVREFFPEAIIVIGGPHVTAMPYATMSYNYFDIGVIGEGEETFLQLIRRIETSGLESLDDIEGIAYKRNGKIVLTKSRDFIKSLDDLPFPARHLLPPLSRYSPFAASYRKLPLCTIISSRGCPMGCSFCDQAVFGSVYRTRSTDNILDEIDLVKNNFGAKEIRFYDDVFTWNRDLIFELCEKMKRRNVKIPWTCFAVVKNISKKLLKEMKAAGCWQVSLGLESGDKRVLRFLKKNISLAQNERAIRWIKEAGLGIRAHFVVGSPWETKESLENTLDFAKKFDLDYAHFIKFMPYPGSEAYKMLVSKGYHFDFTRKFNMLDHTDIMYVPESMTKEEFSNFLVRARKEFYFRLSYILRRIFSVKTWLEIKAQLFGFFAFIFHYKIFNYEKNTAK